MKYWKKVISNNSKNHNHREEKLDLDQQGVSYLSMCLSLSPWKEDRTSHLDQVALVLSNLKSCL